AVHRGDQARQFLRSGELLRDATVGGPDLLVGRPVPQVGDVVADGYVGTGDGRSFAHDQRPDREVRDRLRGGDGHLRRLVELAGDRDIGVCAEAAGALGVAGGGKGNG